MALRPPFGADPFGRSNTAVYRSRLVAAIWLGSAILALLIVRLYLLQVVRGEEMSTKGRRNFVSQLQIPHDRGIIFDRHGEPLVDNRPSLNLTVTPAFLGRLPQAKATLGHLAAIVGMTDEESARALGQVEQRMGIERFRPLLVKRDLTADQVESIEAERSLFLLDGVDIAEGRKRNYLFGSLAAHVLGYVGEIDPMALEAERLRGNPEHYELGDSIGRDGLERTLETSLRGHDGTEKVVVDAKGRRQEAQAVDALLGPHRRKEPRPGHNVFLSIDLKLQQTAEQVFLKHGRAGSVVALDPHTGEVLVLASLPAFNSNVVSGSFSQKEKELLDKDPLKPWLNRSISGQYAPGSTFKVVTALAALSEQITGGSERVLCPGNYRMGRHTWRCHKDAGHGHMDMRDAFKTSCDVFFYTLGGRMGINPIAAMAKHLSFGSRSGIALRGEQPGTVPDEAFHRRVDKHSGGYQRGMAINSSIGQGSVAVTPLQLATAYAAIADGENVYVPQLVHHIESADLRTTRHVTQKEGEAARNQVEGEPPTVVRGLTLERRHPLNFKPEHLHQVRESLRAVAQEPGGTAYRTRSHTVSMAAKTGTAQVVRLGRERLKGWQTDYFERDHAWYVAYAPASDPKIVVAVLNEHAGHGGSAAGPIAVAVIDAFFALEAERAEAHAAPSGGTDEVAP